MHEMKVKRLMGALLALVVLAIGPASQALAAAPDIQPFHVDETFPAPTMSDFCGFPIVRHDVLDGRLIVRHTASGDEVDLQLAQGTATFSASGHSIVGRFGGLHL